MKLQEHDYGFEAVLPENRIPFTIETSAKLFDILSSGIYKDKILAVIRELSCNAYDAHVDAKKKHVPFKLRLPTHLDPTFYVEDEGTGIDPDQIAKIYWTYGKSSKTNSNDQIGALGLGSKSPFAYTKSSFVVKNRFAGREHIYLCFINEVGMPDGSKVSDEPTDKPSGVTVEFAVRPEDIHAFFDRNARFYKHWSATLPIFVDQELCDVIDLKLEKIIEGTDWYLDKSYSPNATAIQGNVPYPIEAASIPNLPKDLSIIASNPFVITFDMGEINFASSREALQYDERTCLNVIARLKEVRQEIESSFKSKVFKTGMTHLEFMANFRKTFNEFSTTIRTNSIAHIDSVEWYINLLLGKRKQDSVIYDSIEWNIERLINGSIRLDVPKHQSFGISKVEKRSSRSTRSFMKQHSTLCFTSISDIEGTLIHPTWHVTSKIKAGEDMHYDWKNAVIPKRAEMNDYYRVLQNSNLFTVNTRHTFAVSDSMIFYVNDLGNSGEARYKALNSSMSNYNRGYFVNFDSKITSVETVISELNDLIKMGLSGSKVELLSTLPDNRPTIDKEKIETGTIRLKYRKIVFEKAPGRVDVNEDAVIMIKEVDSIRSGESIVKIADLLAQSVVPYVIKRRSPTVLYDEIDSSTSTGGLVSILNNTQILAYAAKYVLSDLIEPVVQESPWEKLYAVGRDSIRVLVLNEGQIEWLKKRKVNLVGLRKLISDRISALEATEKFCEDIREATVYSNIPVIQGLHSASSSYINLFNQFKEQQGLFGAIFKKYVEVKSRKSKLAEEYAKLELYKIVDGFTVDTKTMQAISDLILALDKKYPLIRLIPRKLFIAADLLKIINYIETIDAGESHELYNEQCI